MIQQDDAKPRLIGPALLPAQRPTAALGLTAALLTLGLLAGTLGFSRGPDDGGSPIAIAAAPADGTRLIRQVDPSDAGSLARAVALLQLSDPERQQVHAAVLRRELEIGVVTVWDYAEQDGDVVALTSGGFVQNIVLRHEATTIAVPYGGPGAMRLVGIRDGTGGITVAFANGRYVLELLPLRPGEAIEVKVP